MTEKMHSHGLLTERVTNLEAQDRQKIEIINSGRTRLEEIESSKRRFLDLGPVLERLASIKHQLELLEPKRMVYEKTARQMAAARAALQGEEKALTENKIRLSELGRDYALLDELKPKEMEYANMQTFLIDLEKLRDKHGELQTCLKEETVRREAILANLARTKKAIGDLHIAQTKLYEIAPFLEEEKRLKVELAELTMQKEKQKELEGLTSRKVALDSRRARLESEAAKARNEMENLGSLGKLGRRSYAARMQISIGLEPS